MKRMGQDIVQDSILEQDDDLEEDQEDDGDNKDTFDICYTTFIPKTLHTTPPNEDYVALATKPILDKFLEDTILNVAMVDEEADPTRDLEELESLLVENPHFTDIQVHSIITKTKPFIHTQPMSPLYGIFESYKSSTKPYKVDREMKSPSRYGLKSSFPYPVANEHPNDVYCYFHPHLIPSEGMDTLLPKTLTRLHASTWATKWFKRLVAYAKCNRDSYERTHFKSGFVRYHAEDDDGILVIVDVA
ncbi:hypothetical protein Tco_0157678 [Tanacetum coccineum]